MQILRARENGMIFKKCLACFDLKETYLLEFVDFEIKSSIEIFFPFLFIMISKKGSWVSLLKHLAICLALLNLVLNLIFSHVRDWKEVELKIYKTT